MPLELVLEEFPPILCRLLARKGKKRRPYSSRELSEISGLSRDMVNMISAQTSWNNVRIKDMLAFTKACGVDLTDLKRQREYIKRKGWAHLKYPPHSRYFESIMNQLYLSKLTHLHD